jgi:thiol:disulfide interchange protein DsbD
MVGGKAKWLVCKEECIPGEAQLAVSLPVGTTPRIDTSVAALYAETDRRRPLTGHDWTVAGHVSDSTVVLALTPPDWHSDSLTTVDFLPYEQKVIENAAPQRLTMTEDGYRLTVVRSHYSLEKPERLSGILISESGWRGPGSEKALAFDIPVTENLQAVAVASAINGVFKALLFAFLGGLILNLMPCVLPVLSIKVLGFVQQAGEGRKRALGHSLVFTAGVLSSFWVLAGALTILRAGGEQLGWGFQLQSPTFLVILSGFMFLFGLNLMGVFELGTSLAAAGGKRVSGRAGSFLTGVTATVVATPCTAPFMGSALGFSLTQPAWVGWLIFTALGLGMAAPYVVLSASPGLLRFVPKPGRWMETLKQFMGFLLMATVIWLAWVLGVQAGLTAVLMLLVMLLVLGIGAWMYGRWGALATGSGKRRTAFVVALSLVVAAMFGGVQAIDRTATTARAVTESGSGIVWEPFSQERVEELRSAGETMFIDFTAAWCLSCKVNERVALGSAEVQKRFAELGIVALKADWTSRSDEITRALATYGRNSVPLYVVYGPETEPVILPEILTPGIVLDALEKLEH